MLFQEQQVYGVRCILQDNTMTEKYIKSDGKVYQDKPIDASKKILALQDRIVQLNAELLEVQQEISELNDKK